MKRLVVGTFAVAVCTLATRGGTTLVFVIRPLLRWVSTEYRWLRARVSEVAVRT